MDRPARKTGNALLDAVDDDLRMSLMDHATVRSIDLWGEYVTVGQDVGSVFFPIRGSLSLLAQPDDETIVEAATIGREGAADIFVASEPCGRGTS